ncbi:hypothetical protein RYX36_024654, partial [Vicia faba]
MLRASRVHYDQGQFEFLQSEKVSQLFPTTIDIKSLNYPLHDLNFLSMKLTSVNPMFYDMATDLDTFMVRPEKLNNLASPSPLSSSVSHCNSPKQGTTFADTTTMTPTNIFQTTNDYNHLLDTSASVFLQRQRSNVVSE